MLAKIFVKIIVKNTIKLLKRIKMKKILFTILLGLSLFGKNAIILTSQPNYKTMKLITTDSLWQTRPKFNGTTYVTFKQAYKDFYNAVTNTINKNVNKYKHVNGVVNLKINYSVDKDWYYFWSTYDYFSFK